MQTSRYWIFFQVAPRYVRTPFSNGVRNEGFYGPHYEMGVAHIWGLDIFHYCLALWVLHKLDSMQKLFLLLWQNLNWQNPFVNVKYFYPSVMGNILPSVLPPTMIFFNIDKILINQYCWRWYPSFKRFQKISHMKWQIAISRFGIK